MSDTPDTQISERLTDLADGLAAGDGLGDLPLGWSGTLAMLRDAADEIDRLTAALADRDATIAELREALDWHIDESPCRFDHNGHCQEHYDFAMRPGDICGMERSRRLLAEETP